MGDASTIDAAAAARIAQLEAALVARDAALEAAHARQTALIAERDRLREAYQQLQIEVELMRRRLFVAKAERIDTAQLELEFAGKLAQLDALAGQLPPTDQPPAGGAAGAAKRRRTPTGRRDFDAMDLPEEHVEVVDAEREGKAPRLAPETTREVRWRRGGFVRLIVTRWKYKTQEDMPIVTAPMPPKMIPRSFAAPSLLAHIASEKFCYGLPLYRQEQRYAELGCPIDRGTMCRWLEDLGLTVGATVVQAMRADALANAFCIATDATGVLVQPIREAKQQAPRACRRGHYFVQIADADHVFFEYTPKETSEAVGEMFKGFSGYVQADAKSVYDFLYRPPDRVGEADADPEVRHEVGCWSHARRKFWEAAITTKDVPAREALARIARIFDLDRSWKKRPHVEIKDLREQHLRPHVDAFFTFADEQYERVRDQRGLLRSAFGYAQRQRPALTRFFDDGRLKLTNNGSERELRRIAVGRKAWLFVGSDDHAQAAGNLLTLIASARLHGIDPEQYLAELFIALPQWPRDRYLELAPKHWSATRARLSDAELDKEIVWLTIPSPLSSTTTAP